MLSDLYLAGLARKGQTERVLQLASATSREEAPQSVNLKERRPMVGSGDILYLQGMRSLLDLRWPRYKPDSDYILRHQARLGQTIVAMSFR